MNEKLSRRDAVKVAAAAAMGGMGVMGVMGGMGGMGGIASNAMGAQPASVGKAQPSAPVQTTESKPLFKISLAQWSLHRALQTGTLDHLDFPKTAKEVYGILAVEYVNVFFKEKNSKTYLKELRQRCDDLGVRSVLIMCDNEGNLGDPSQVKRATAVENHYKWADAAKFLGCHSIRVNARSEGTYDEQMERAADGLRQLCTYGDPHGINVIVENHGGLSSNGAWLAGVMKKVNHPRVGTLPDFGNFKISDTEEYDRYKGVAELMPFAKGVSAKSREFTDNGEAADMDYRRLMKIVLDAGYHGHVGIEYEGKNLSEPEGIKATKKLLEKILVEMSVAPGGPK